MSKPETSKYLEQFKKLGPSQRSRLTRNLSYETWNVDLAIIKADRIRKRILAIRRTIYVICIIHLVWHLLNTMALLYAIVIKFKPLVHIGGLAYNMVALTSLAVYHRSVRFKSMRLNTLYLSLTWFYLIFAFSINLVLLALFYGTKAQSTHLRQRVTDYKLDFDDIDLLSSVIYFFVYLVLIILLFLMRNSIFESRKYNQSIEKFLEKKEGQEDQDVDQKNENGTDDNKKNVNQSDDSKDSANRQQKSE